MKKFIVSLLIFLSCLALILRFGYQPLVKSLGLLPRAGIRIVSDQKATVSIDGKAVGNTPYQDENLAAGQYLISLQPQTESTQSAKAAWQGYVKLNPSTLTVVNRELANTQAASSGEVITLEKGQGVTIISTPSVAHVSIDGKDVGRTPISLALASGEHQFLVSKDNFLKRSIRATVVDNYNLTVNVDLAIAEIDLTKIPTVPITTQAQVVVKPTPTNFLRVRAQADVNSAEVGRVAPGDTLTLIQESVSWDKVKLPDGKEGFVSSSYVEKKSQ